MFQFLLAGRKGGTADVVDGKLQVGTSPATKYEPQSRFMVDSNGSPLMNINGAASGATEGIHDGTDTVLWTASALSGTWDFASTAQAASGGGTKSIDATAVTNGDQAVITRSTPLTSTNYTLMTGEVYLTTYNSTKNTIDFSGRLAGVQSGIAINVGDYIDPSLLNVWQSFQIPVSVFKATGAIDELLITITSNGTPPAFYLDNIDLREGGGIIYSTNLSLGEVFEYNRLDMVIVDAYTGITTVAGATENATMTNLSYDQFLGVPHLDTGITFQRRLFGEVITSGSVKGLADMVLGGARIMSVSSDGTNTMLHARIDFQDWVRLSEHDGDELVAIINDDLTGLIDFKAVLVGREVKQ